MLEGFAISVCRTAAAKRKGPQYWERESRVMMAYGTKLRITPQSQTEPKTAARLRAEAELASQRKPWDEDET
jgi:hypothetical protein